MRFQATLLSLSMALLAGCGSTTAAISSETLSGSQIDAIQANIERLHPGLDSDLKQQVLEVAVKAVDNMVFVEGGEFMMGDFGAPCSPDSLLTMQWSPDVKCAAHMDADALPGHPVTLDSFHIARYETTWNEFDAFRLAQGKPVAKHDFRQRNAKRTPREYNPAYEPNYPATTKDWQEVKDHCQWLGELTGYPFDLPSEAQWEYAARNRGQNIYYATDTGQVVRGTNALEAGQGKVPVGTFPPSPLGLYDMSGNVSEWVNDWYDPDYYDYSPEQNPTGPTQPVPTVPNWNKALPPIAHKIVRGGNYTESPTPLTNRYPRPPTKKTYSVTFGFRCAVQQPTPLD